MKRGFEDNVSRVRPRVRLGQPDQGPEDESQEMAPPSPVAPAGVAGLPVAPPVRRTSPPILPSPVRGARRRRRCRAPGTTLCKWPSSPRTWAPISSVLPR